MSNIIGNLPDNLTNGTTADASQVMADLNFIVNEVNANAMPATPGSFTTNGNQTINGTVTVNEQGQSQTTVTINAPSDANGANILLVGNGASTPNKTIRSINGDLQVVDSAYTTVILILDDAGNLTATGNIVSEGNITATGNVTAYSDERLKKDWKPVAQDFLEKLSAIKSGTYTRTDSGERQTGVSAQDLQGVLPEAVSGAEILSVAYGQAALVACVELANEVMRLRALLEPVK